MPLAPGPPDPEASGQQLTLYRVGWEQFVTINDALDERPGLRMIFCDGRLTFLKPSRRHEWFAGRLGELTVAVASGLRILWETAGRSTFRREELKVGVEGDKTFYCARHAEVMQGPRGIDLTVQPPPDLAIEVEVGRVTDQATTVWGRLGVPEVWRFGLDAMQFDFGLRGNDGSYVLSNHSRMFPTLTPEDVVNQMRLAERIGTSAWYRQLDDWVRKEIRPRHGGGG
jgi:Uma2 family endonuclease